MSAPVEYLNPPNTAPAQGLYSHIGVARADKVFHIAGQLSVDLAGNIVGRHDFEAQYTQVFQNMRDVLNGVGLDFPNVVKFTTLFVRSQDIELFMRLRAETFPKWFSGDVFPPNTILVIDRLVKEDFLFEVEAVAQS
ncbi:MAG: RidA family protein [Pseudomonadota bacterium]